MVQSGVTVPQAMKKLGIEKVDASDLEHLCRELLEKAPHIVADVKSGKEKAIGAIVGQARQKNPNVNPGEVKRICLELIARM
jgi:aspartyl-tRNA(Asn)/glutamyl-tRNA(Gln) amidotransferase subunit B